MFRFRKIAAVVIVLGVMGCAGRPANIEEYAWPDFDFEASMGSLPGPELKSLRYNGIIMALEPGVFDYTVTLPSRHRTFTIPALEWETGNASHTVTAFPSASIPGTVVLHVENLSGIRSTYTVRFEKSPNPEAISRTTSWVGNSFPGTGNAGASWPNADGGWVQNWVLGFYAGADGALYTASQWDEGGRKNSVYKSGPAGGYAAGLHSVSDAYVQIVDGAGKAEQGGPAGGPQNRQVMRVERTALIDGKVVEMDPALATVSTDRRRAALEPADTLVENRVAWVIDNNQVARQTQTVTRTPGALTAWGVDASVSGHIKRVNVTAETGRFSLPNSGEPGALAIANHNPNLLIVADNKNGVILFYDVANPNTPRLAETFGSGYLTAGTPGSPPGNVSDPKKFWDVVGVGTDSAGNLYVAQSNLYTLLKAFGPAAGGSRSFLWQLESFGFVDLFDFDPATNGNDIYGMTTRYTATGSSVPGQDYRLASYTMDLQKYPYDPRGLYKTRRGHPVSSVTMRYIGGQKYMFLTGMHYGRLYMYRFDGEIAVPYAVITDQRQTLGYYESEWAYLNNDAPVPNQPAGNVSYIWIDRNGDGQFDANEFAVLPGSPGRLNTGSSHSWTVDNNGDIWIVLQNANNGTGGRGLLQLRADTSGGRPIYTWANSVRYDIPAEYAEVRRLQYDPAGDVMYLMGHTADYPSDGGAWGSGGRVIYRYNNWKASHSAAGGRNRTVIQNGFPIIVPYVIASTAGHGATNISASTLHLAGERLFVAFGGRGPLGFAGAELHVFDTATGRNLGALTPGEVVGGHTNVGLLDIPEAVRAIKTNRLDSAGNPIYKVLVEEDYFAKNLLYTMNSNPARSFETDGERWTDPSLAKAQKLGKGLAVNVNDDPRSGGFWDMSHKLTVQQNPQSPVDTAANDISFGAVWNEGNLYICVQVKEAAAGGTAALTLTGANDAAWSIAISNSAVTPSPAVTGFSSGRRAIADGYIVTMAIPYTTANLINAVDLTGNAKDPFFIFDLRYTPSGGTGGLKFAQGGMSEYGSLSVSDNVYLAPYAITAVSVDAQFNEPGWDITRKLHKGDSPAEVLFGAMWDELYLYVGIQVFDNTPNSVRLNLDGTSAQGTSYFRGDSLEVVIDGNNDKSGPYDAFDVQYTIPYGLTDILHAVSKKEGVLFVNKTRRGIGRGGFDVEMAIPWTTLNMLDPIEAGRLVGFDINYNDKQVSTADNRAATLVWAGTGSNFQDTSRFGELKLMPATATGLPVPAQLAGLAVERALHNNITLAWSDPRNRAVKGCRVQYAIAGTEFADPATRIVPGSRARITGLVPNTHYEFRVTAYNGAQQHSQAAVIVARTRANILLQELEVRPDMVRASDYPWSASGPDRSVSRQENGWRAFDGTYTSYVETNDTSGWVQVDFGAPKTVQRVAYAPRSGQGGRMQGAEIMGSRNGRRWVPLHTISGAAADNRMTVVDIDNTAAYRYYRYSSPVHSHTNIARLAFYEYQPGPPSVPANLTAAKGTGQTVELSWGASFPGAFGLTGYRITWDNMAVTGSKTVPAGAFQPGQAVTAVLDELLGYSRYTVSVQAYDSQGRHSDREEASVIVETDQSGFEQIPVNIGMVTAQGVSVNTAMNLFSKDTAQYVDMGNNGSWVQVDLGNNAKAVTVVQYQTRFAGTPSEMNAWPLRMLGLKIQASANGNDWVDLYEITRLPEVNTLTYVNVGNTTPYRYYRYLTPGDAGTTSIGLLELWARR